MPGTDRDRDGLPVVARGSAADGSRWQVHAAAIGDNLYGQPVVDYRFTAQLPDGRVIDGGGRGPVLETAGRPGLEVMSIGPAYAGYLWGFAPASVSAAELVRVDGSREDATVSLAPDVGLAVVAVPLHEQLSPVAALVCRDGAGNEVARVDIRGQDISEGEPDPDQ